MNTLQSWSDYIMQLHTKRIDLSLDRMMPVAQRMDLLTFDCPVITVAGTNGKGSCVAALEAMYSAAGYHVGCYTSPELLHFCERIRVGQQAISETALLQAFQEVESARANTTLSFFEFTTLAAFFVFKYSDIDVLVLEVGLGGRLDTVNVIDADITIITSIGLDHTEFLGNDRATIAREKAGIMRYGRPVICGDQDPPTSIQQTASQVGAKLLQLNKAFNYSQDDDSLSWVWSSNRTQLSDLPVPAIRLDNAACALQAIDCLQGKLPVSIQAIKTGLQSVSLPGRFEQQSFQRVPVILDVAHNPDAVRALVENLNRFDKKVTIHAVFTCAANKDIQAMVRLLKSQIAHWYIAPLFPSYSPEGAILDVSNESIASLLQQLNCQYTCLESVEKAFESAHNECRSSEDNLILVFGSFKTVAAIKRAVVFDKEQQCLQ